MKIYRYNGRMHWFDEGKAPEGAVPVSEKPEKAETEAKAVEMPENKAVTPRNKAGKVRKK